MTSQHSSSLWILLLAWNFGELSESQKFAEAIEFLCVQGFSEYIGYVVVGVDIGEGYFVGLNALAEKVVFDVDVFYAVV